MILQNIRLWLQEKRNLVLLLSGVILIVVAASFCIGLFATGTESVEPILTPMEPTSTPDIKIDVKGNVVNPGVYTLPGGSRVQDAVLAAGGFSSPEDEQTVNLAQVLTDGEMIVIGQNKINLNQADKEQLKTLPGIGDTLADRILNYREENGDFYSIDEIMYVKGIGEGKFKELESLITVGKENPNG